MGRQQAVTLGFTVLGGIVGGGIGAAIGGVLGGLAASRFSGDDPEPEILVGNELTGASEGDPIYVIFGRQVRVPGVVIWAGDKRVQSGSPGAKGGPGRNRAKMDSVFQDFAVKFNKGTKIDNLLRIWANNVLIFDRDPVVGITDHRYQITRQTHTIDSAWGPPVTQVWMELHRISDWAPSLHDNFLPGTELTISGATGSPNNTGTFIVDGHSNRYLVEGLSERDTVSSISGSAVADIVTVTMGSAHGRYPGTEHQVKIIKASGSPSILGWQDCTFTTSTEFEFNFLNPAASYAPPLKVARNSVPQETLRLRNQSASDGDLGTSSLPGTLTKVAEKIRTNLLGSLIWHDGDETVDETIDDIEAQRTPQLGDPHITAIEGAAVPMLGHAFITFEGMQLNDFGNSTPNITIEAEADAAETTVSAIGKMLDKGGLTGAQYDTTNCTPKPLYHYVWRGVQKTSRMIQPIMQFGDYVAQEDAGVLRIFDRDPRYVTRQPRNFARSNNDAITYTGSTLTDTRQSWEVDEWVGTVVEADTETMIVTSNTETVLSGSGGWGGTPTAGAGYTIHTASMDAIGDNRLVDIDADWTPDRWVGAVVTSETLGAGLVTMTVTSNTATELFGTWSSVVEEYSRPYTIDPGTDIPIDSNNLAARSPGSDIPERLTLATRSDVDIPTEVQLSYVNVESNHDRGVAVERDETAGADNVLKINSQIGMTEAQANAMATRVLWTEISQRETGTFALPPSHMFLAEGDRVTITEGGEPRVFLLTKIDRGENGILECEGIRQQTVNTRPSLEVAVAPAT